MPNRTMSQPKNELMICARYLPTSSMIDCKEYRQEIDRYQRQCARLENPYPKVRLLGQADERPLERRYSF